MNRLLRLFRTGLVALVAAVCINAFAQLPADFLNRPHEADESRDAVRASIVTNRTAATPGSPDGFNDRTAHKLCVSG